MSWKTVAICDDCWYSEEGMRIPLKMKEEVREEETCYSCGEKTKSGIYVRREINDARK